MIQHIATSLTETVSQVADRKAVGGVDYIGIPTGFSKLDQYTGGLRDSNLYVFAGRTGMGKSAFGLSVAVNTARAGYSSLYVSLEMSNQVLAMRMLSGLSGVDAMAAEYGKISDEEFLNIQLADASLRNLPLWCLDDVVDSEKAIAAAKEIEPIDLLFIDHASLLSDRYGQSEFDRVSRIVQTMRQGATDLGIPVVALAQLNRQVEYRDPPIPILSDLRDSGSFEQDASGVFFLYRPQYYANLRGGAVQGEYLENDAQIIVAKNRFGPTGTIKAKFYPTRMYWEQ